MPTERSEYILTTSDPDTARSLRRRIESDMPITGVITDVTVEQPYSGISTSWESMNFEIHSAHWISHALMNGSTRRMEYLAFYVSFIDKNGSILTSNSRKLI